MTCLRTVPGLLLVLGASSPALAEGPPATDLVAPLVAPAAVEQAPPPAPAPACRKVALVPVEGIAVRPDEARVADGHLRAALAALEGLCPQPAADTQARLGRYKDRKLPACRDDVCRAAQVAELDVDILLAGTVVGFAGVNSATLQAYSRKGAVQRTRVNLESGGGEASMGAVLQALFGALDSGTPVELPAVAAAPAEPAPPVVAEVVEAPRRSRLPFYVAAGAAVAALATGTAFGLAASSSERAVTQGSVGCSGAGDPYVQCFESRVERGRSQARAANVAYGAAGVLAAGATVIWVWELP
jgi:hypothetical protein